MILENSRTITDIHRKNKKRTSKFTAVLKHDDDENLRISLRLESEIDGVLDELIDPDVEYYEMTLKPVKPQV